MADALESLEEVNQLVAALEEEAAHGRTKSIEPAKSGPIVKKIASLYFLSVRESLLDAATRSGLVEEIDFVMQSLLQLATDRREKVAILGQLTELKPYLSQATVDILKAKGRPNLVLSDFERGVLATLSSMIPASAASYEQALRDISRSGRVSWRGTAAELRETLREVIDHLAPDNKVMAVPGFQLEPDQRGPTQKQKIRFILRARRKLSATITMDEAALDTVEESFAKLGRSAYQSGNASTHAGADAKEIRSLKRCIDAVLGELLEIG